MMIDQLSQKFGINLRYFLPTGAWVGGRFLAVSALSLLGSIAFARLATKDFYGQYQYVLSLASLVSVFTLPGFNTAALKAFVEGDHDAVRRSVRYSFLFGLIATATLFVIGVLQINHGQAGLGWAIIAAGALLPFYYAPNNWYVYYEGALNFRSSTIRIVATNLVLLVGLLLGLYWRLPLVALVATYFGVNAVLTGYFYLEGRKLVKSSGPKLLSLPYAFRCTLQKFTVMFAENIQAIVISAFYGFASVAIFQVANSVINAFTGLTGSLSSTYFPLLLKYRTLNYRLIVVQHLVLGVVAWLVYLAIARFAFTLLYGEGYHESLRLLYALSGIVLILPLRVYLANFFTANDRNFVVINANAVANVVAILFFFLNRSASFSLNLTTYLYILNGLVLLPMLAYYLWQTRSGQLEQQPK